MRLLCIFCLYLLLFNCENKPSQNKKTEPTTNPETSTTKTQKDSIPPKEEAFKKLTDSTAMYFFQDYDKKHKENKVRITTDFGSFDILLYNETKFHRSNFIFLTKKKYFDGSQFYRIINDYIIQGGGSDEKITAKKRSKIGSYLLPVDKKQGFKHERGAISMPSSDINNPHKLASPYEFFIVQKKGGAHFLDGDYTVFGKVIKGMDVVDKIAAVETDDGDWPTKNVYIRTVEIIE